MPRSRIGDVAEVDPARAKAEVLARIEKAGGTLRAAAVALGVTGDGLRKLAVRHGFLDEVKATAARCRQMRKL